MGNFDLDLSRVTYEHYITGKAAINFPRLQSSTGGWHYLSYWDSTSGQAKVSLAGIHYPDTTFYFGDAGILDASEELNRRGWQVGNQVFMADHFRAAGDMVLAWALGQSKHCNVELSEWFPNISDLNQIVRMLNSTITKLDVSQRERLKLWLAAQNQQVD